MKVIDNKTLFSMVRDSLLEGQEVNVTVRGQSMLPFFSSGSTIHLRPLRAGDLQRGHVVLGETPTGSFVVHRIVEANDREVVLMGDGNVAGTERLSRAQVYGIVDCGWVHLTLARLWLWLRPVRKYPLWFLKRICRK